MQKKTQKLKHKKSLTTARESKGEKVFAERLKRIKKLQTLLKEMFPKASIALSYKTHWELLVAVELSAQCTDKKVNEVTAHLFKKYRTLHDYVHADIRAFEQDIKSTGFYRNKAKNILSAARLIDSKHNGVLPKTMEEMLTIPGVARKTANVVLGNAYGIVEGIAVDTHVKRFAIRFNLTDSRNPEKIEQDLMALLPKKEWFDFTYRVIEYGRTVAPARVYDTRNDPLVAMYPPAGTVFRV